MFAISNSPIECPVLSDPRGGAVVVFEGRVRDHNAGKVVTRLEYEAYIALAEKEGLKIIQEALGAFDILAARCTHRVGVLQIGEVAVWVVVQAAHRQAAFQACQYIIEEVKRRVPIWKKEYGPDGSHWVEGVLPGPATDQG